MTRIQFLSEKNLLKYIQILFGMINKKKSRIWINNVLRINNLIEFEWCEALLRFARHWIITDEQLGIKIIERPEVSISDDEDANATASMKLAWRLLARSGRVERESYLLSRISADDLLHLCAWEYTAIFYKSIITIYSISAYGNINTCVDLLLSWPTNENLILDGS